jgi:hypothetical protein
MCDLYWKVEENLSRVLKHASTGSVLAPFFSPPRTLIGQISLSHTAHTFISSQPLQQPPEQDLVTLKREAVCSSKTSGYTSTTWHRNTKEDHHTCMQNIVIMKRISLKIL